MEYTIIQKIDGSGNFGEVYRCKDENGNLYAMKIMKEVKRLPKVAEARFSREVRIMSRLNHPNVIKIIASDLSSEKKYFVMPLYKKSLVDLIPTLKGDYEAQLKVINAILTGLAYIHSEGVIHRDLKPENILVNDMNDIVICDFGFGLQVDSDSATLTRNGLGTLKYCSPEQLDEGHTVDYRTDIFSVGRIIDDIVSNNGYDRESVHPSIELLIQKCLNPRREDRYSSVEELQGFVNDVYNLIMSNGRSLEIDNALFQLKTDSVKPGSMTTKEIQKLAVMLQDESDQEKTEKFFANISAPSYKEFEKADRVTARALVKCVCDFWNQSGWPFSYIDYIANTCQKIFVMSEDAEVRAAVLMTLMEIAIEYNRYHAMHMVRSLFEDVSKDITLQTSLAMKLNANNVDLGKIFLNVDQLPEMIRKNHKKEPTEHTMKLRPEPFGLICDGKKTIEMRLYDEKRKKIQIGDLIRFVNTENEEVLRTKVEELLLFDSFEALYQNLPLECLGYTEDTIDKASAADMEQYYSREEQELFGVVGIRITLL